MTVRFWLFHPARSAMLASCDKRSASVEASRSLGSERPSAGPFCRLKLSAQLMIVLHGRYDEARSLFERLLSRCNDVGLLAEEFDPLTGRMLGNFPQAYCHVGIINCALNLSRQKGPAGGRSEPSERDASTEALSFNGVAKA